MDPDELNATGKWDWRSNYDGVPVPTASPYSSSVLTVMVDYQRDIICFC